MNVSRKYIRQMKRVNTLFTVECHILVLKRTMVRRIEFHQTNWETPVDTWLSTYKTMPALSLEKLRITQTYNFESLLCLRWKCIRGTFWLNVQHWTVHRPAWRWWQAVVPALQDIKWSRKMPHLSNTWWWLWYWTYFTLY